MMTRLTAIVSAATLAVSLTLAGGLVSPVQASASTNTHASQLCTTNHNAVFGPTVPISHGACVATIASKAHSSALYTSLCRYVVPHGGTLSGIAVSTAPNFLDTTTSTTLTNILSKVTMPSSGKFTSVGQCVSAFNKAKKAAMHPSSTTHGSGKH